MSLVPSYETSARFSFTASKSAMSKPLSTKTDEELLRLLQLNKEEAFEALYERYERPLYNFILRYVRDGDLAQDLFQETFLRLYRKSRSYRRRASVKTWLFAIARNLCLKHLSRTREELAPNPLGSEDDVPSERPGPETSVEQAELLRKVEEALYLLPATQRELLLLSRVEEMSYKEIARVVGSTPAAVKVAVFRALQALREKLNLQPTRPG